MKKSIKVLLLLTILSISLVGYSINISVSIQPYYLILKEIISEEDNLNIIVPAGKSPHTYSVTSKDIVKIYDSDLIIFNGLNSEVFLDNIMSNIEKKNIPIIFISKLIPKEELILNEDHEDDHGYFNPHIWLNPYFIYEYIIPGIVNKLTVINPDKKEIYINNAEILKEKLKLLDAYLLVKSREINGSIITYHNSFPYFAKRYNINIAGVIEESPGVEPSISEMKRLADLAKSNNVKALFSEPQMNEKIAEKLAKTLNIKLGVIDPLGSSYNSIDELYLINFINILNSVR
ncbi:metal ABC transporter substrate-binding protein [Marinitoga litoralis]|jgi:zinc transport system substrate-binding protein|uniref:metal ABC transporter substrate-binding protein n=1 Tax=Marinitoga litoralis TaxID=570855 RepID=UPI00195FE788|nr:metal ABC transporter substrate-binding protein [Marinitoga litoralis]MBM7560085.1 zinc transport system substrate-binding protein [Marinitoga litoralis]